MQGGIMVKKQSNFQLLKILAMLMIVAHHLVSKNAFNVDTEIVGLTANKLLLQILGNNAFIGNNLFFLISAWFLSSKAEDSINLKYSFSSCVRLERIVLFYSISLLCLSLIFNRGGKLNISAEVYISNFIWFVVVSNNIHSFSFNVALLS
jgi:brp/blh family beta-carotene 15,15'-monooxygenase